jgi:hypothetical protein
MCFVWEAGFEPATSSVRGKHATRLRYTQTKHMDIGTIVVTHAGAPPVVLMRSAVAMAADPSLPASLELIALCLQFRDLPQGLGDIDFDRG